MTGVFLLQTGIWVWVTLLPTMLLNNKQTDTELTTRDYAGWTVWLAGFLLEAIADYQKYTFRSNPANHSRWISHGLWSIVRHPNYLGEIIMWFGLFLSASTTFQSTEYLSVLSPVCVALLLTKLSGIPILERRNLRMWKDNPQFMEYLRTTSRLFPGLY